MAAHFGDVPAACVIDISSNIIVELVVVECNKYLDLID